MELEIRWMSKADLSEAAKIMRSCGVESDERKMGRLVSKPTVVCMVAEHEGSVVGLLVYDVGRVSKVKILALAVLADQRRKGVGSRLMSVVTSKLTSRRNKVELSVSEYNLDAQLFLRSAGFRAVSVVDNAPDPSEYRFLYRLSESAASEP